MSKIGFNLLRPQIEPPTVWTRLYDWVVNTARIIVIVVELVVVVAFGVRIVLDVQSGNLDQEIKTKEAIVLSFQEAEVRYLSLQNRTAAYHDVIANTKKYSGVMSEIVNYIPRSSSELVISLGQNSGLFVSGSAEIDEIQQMEESFKSSASFTRQELDSVEGEGNTSVATYSFSAQLLEIASRGFPSSMIESDIQDEVTDNL